MIRSLLTILLAIALTSCATYTPEEFAVIRSRGVPDRLLQKMEDRVALSPPEIITLSRRDVPDYLITRYLEDVGVNYLVTRQDVLRMREAGVRVRVIEALLTECELFASSYASGSGYAGDSSFWWAEEPYFGPSLYYPVW